MGEVEGDALPPPASEGEADTVCITVDRVEKVGASGETVGCAMVRDGVAEGVDARLRVLCALVVAFRLALKLEEALVRAEGETSGLEVVVARDVKVPAAATPALVPFPPSIAWPAANEGVIILETDAEGESESPAVAVRDTMLEDEELYEGDMLAVDVGEASELAERFPDALLAMVSEAAGDKELVPETLASAVGKEVTVAITTEAVGEGEGVDASVALAVKDGLWLGVGVCSAVEVEALFAPRAEDE